MEDKKLEQRLRAFWAVIIVIILIVCGRLWELQIRRGTHYANMAEGNRMRRIRVMPTRGVIYSRDGRELVRSRPAFTVALVPGGIPRNAEGVLEYLSEILNLTSDELQEAIDKGRQNLYEPVRIARDVDLSTVVAIEENRLRLPGVFIEEEWVRDYLYPSFASHLIGYLGIINEQELKRFGTGYASSDLVGKTGLEAIYEQELRGVLGSVMVEVNALSRPVQTVSYVEPIPGHNLILTIDKELQEAAREAFLAHTSTLQEEGASQFKGAVVALDPKTGEILAMVSLPDYDPAKLLDARERNSYYASLVANTDQPLFNRAVQGKYGPGSAFKPLIAVAMLEEKVVTPSQVFNATGTSESGIRDWVITQGSAPFGEIKFVDALAMSSNHYFAEFGKQVGIDRLSVWLREFGFGAPTGMIGAAQEESGLVPDRDWKRQRYFGYPTYEQAWYPADTEQVSIGQGPVEVTPIQLTVAYSAIANRGVIYQPTVVKKIIDPEGEIVYEHSPTVKAALAVAESTWDAVTEGMEAVITHPRGTARRVFEDFPIPIAGKTGSVEITNRPSHGWFAAFAPTDDPELVVVVIVEHGTGGATSAAPIARMVFDAYFGLGMQE
ncbi:MAG: penicillin-binding protein 2 [Firmicutes bacterium]|nr:penicillin-binding protein 2 [Bacillota bacterium]NLL88316.1 penicillin-binding protein 2 [Bacillota bacterium]